jgi:hypothetical protein
MEAVGAVPLARLNVAVIVALAVVAQAGQAIISAPGTPAVATIPVALGVEALRIAEVVVVPVREVAIRLAVVGRVVRCPCAVATIKEARLP